MKKYKVTLEKEERENLEAITRKGSHQSQRVVNALILLNCDEGSGNEKRMRGEDEDAKRGTQKGAKRGTGYSLD